MNYFLDQILNPPPSVKRKSLSQRNSLSIKTSQKNQQRQQVQNFDSNRIPSQGQNEEYQIQQITEQVIFDQEEINIDMQQEQNINVNRNTGLSKFNHNENMKSQQNQDIQDQQCQNLVRNNLQEDPLYFNKNNQHNDRYLKKELKYQEDLQNQEGIFQQYNQVQNQKLYDMQVTRPFLNQKTIQNLINGINEAKLAQKQLQIWFMNQKYHFSTLFQENTILINRKIKQTIQKLSQKSNRSSQINKNQQFESKMSYFKKQQNSSSIQQTLSLQRKWQIQKKLIKQQLQQRYQYRIQKLQSELQEQRKFTLQRMNQANIQTNGSPRNSQLDYNHLFEELQFLKQQISSKEAIIHDLQFDNQKLNQHIFDIEQRIEGIQLQVQTRVRDKLKQLQNQQKSNTSITKNKQNFLSPSNQNLNPILEASARLQQSSKLFGNQSINFNQKQKLQQFQQLKKQNIRLKQFIKQIEIQVAQREQQIKQHQKIVYFRQEQIVKNQQDINFQWAQLERQKNQNFLRQQQLTTAEQNLSRKISEIRAKEQQLDKWQIQLKKREISIQARQQQLNRKIEDCIQKQNQLKMLERQNSYKNLQRQKENNLIKIERQSMHNTSLNNMRSKKNMHDFNYQISNPYSRPNGIQIPDLAIGRKCHQDLDNHSKYEKGSIYHQNQYQFRNKEIVKPSEIQQLNKSYNSNNKTHISNFRQKQKMTITGNNFRSGRGYQYVLPQSSKNNVFVNRSISKSRSKQKNLVRNFNNSNIISSGLRPGIYSTQGNKYMKQMYQNKQQNNLDGLGSKLQRLRDQIKRQIDSIK